MAGGIELSGVGVELVDEPGSGTVTSTSVVTANGFAGSVASPTTTPAITISTTVTGILSGNGTAISSASTTGSGAVVLANTPTLITPVLGVATGTSIALGGATISTNAFAITGTASFGGKVTIVSGNALQIGNAATTGLAAGVIAALTNATIVITDANGQAYRIPCII